MLKRFEVENFKGFDQKVIFDLCARDYSFNNHLIKNGIVNKAILYGKNGIGKSSLGIALLDITSHLTDKERMPAIYLANYRNLTNPNKPVFFKYVFQFGNDELVYEYQKSESDYLISEYLEINHICIIDYSYFDSNKQFIDKSILGKISEISYQPNEFDKDRFLLLMDDGNSVYLTLTKFEMINYYNEVLGQLEGRRGILYLDSGNHFKIME